MMQPQAFHEQNIRENDDTVSLPVKRQKRKVAWSKLPNCIGAVLSQIVTLSTRIQKPRSETLNYSKTVNRRKQNQHVVVALMHPTKSE